MPHCYKKSRKKSRNQRKMRGGRAVFPSEYFGVDSGRYTETPTESCPSAYGKILARSMGTGDLSQGFVGANLHVHPNSSFTQTGGSNKRKSRSSSRNGRSNQSPRRGRSRNVRSNQSPARRVRFAPANSPISSRRYRSPPPSRSRSRRGSNKNKNKKQH